MLCRWHFGDESSSLAYSVILIGADTQATNTGNMGIINRQNRKAKERYRKAWDQAVYAFKAHPSAVSRWESGKLRRLTWAASIARQFHRSLLALAGRHGCLSQMYHKGRGLSKRRLQAAKVIHHYGIKREGNNRSDAFIWNRAP